MVYVRLVSGVRSGSGVVGKPSFLYRPVSRGNIACYSAVVGEGTYAISTVVVESDAALNIHTLAYRQIADHVDARCIISPDRAGGERYGVAAICSQCRKDMFTDSVILYRQAFGGQCVYFIIAPYHIIVPYHDKAFSDIVISD